MKVYITTATSKSGDDYGPITLIKKPSDKELEKIWRQAAPQEFVEESDGPGNWGSYLHVELVESEVIGDETSSL